MTKISSHACTSAARRGMEEIEELFCHENQTCPPALSGGGNLFTGIKIDLITCLEEISNTKTETPVTTRIVLDGAAISQMRKPAASKTFEEYAHQIFITYYLRSYKQCHTWI